MKVFRLVFMLDLPFCPISFQSSGAKARFRLVLIAVVLLLYSNTSSAQEQTTKSSYEYLDRMKRSTEALSEAYHRAPGRTRVTTKDTFNRIKTGNAALVSSSKNVEKDDLASDSFLFQSERTVNTSGTKFLNTCMVINSRYCFYLRKWDVNKPWLIGNCVVTSDPDVDTQKIGFEASYRRPSRQPRQMGAASIASEFHRHLKLASLPGLPGLEIESISDGKPPLSQVELNFTYENPKVARLNSEKPEHTSAKVRCKLMLDSEHHFVPLLLHEDATAFGQSHTFVATRNYVFENGLPTRVKANSRLTVRAGQSNLIDREEVEESTYDYRSVPESEFTLTAYGFPEPSGVDWNSRRIPLYAVVMIAGVVLLVSFVALRARRRA